MQKNRLPQDTFHHISTEMCKNRLDKTGKKCLVVVKEIKTGEWEEPKPAPIGVLLLSPIIVWRGNLASWRKDCRKWVWFPQKPSSLGDQLLEVIWRIVKASTNLLSIPFILVSICRRCWLRTQNKQPKSTGVGWVHFFIDLPARMCFLGQWEKIKLFCTKKRFFQSL